MFHPVKGHIFERTKQIVLVFLFSPPNARNQNADTRLVCIWKAPRCSSYVELEFATDGFPLVNFLAEGGFGSVYRGILSDGQSAVAHCDDGEAQQIEQLPIGGKGEPHLGGFRREHRTLQRPKGDLLHILAAGEPDGGEPSVASQEYGHRWQTSNSRYSDAESGCQRNS